MDIQAGNADGIELNLMGAGYVTLNGRAKWLGQPGRAGRARCPAFQADTVSIDLGGLGNASVFARQAADLNLSGLGSVTVYGKPATRNVSLDGLGKVSWK